MCICTCDGVDEVCYLQNPSSQILEWVFFLDVHFRDFYSYKEHFTIYRKFLFLGLNVRKLILLYLPSKRQGVPYSSIERTDCVVIDFSHHKDRMKLKMPQK